MRGNSYWTVMAYFVVSYFIYGSASDKGDSVRYVTPQLVSISIACNPDIDDINMTWVATLH